MLIPEAKQAWRFTSVQIMALLAVISVIEANWDILSKLVPEKYHPWVVAAFSVAALIARLWPQPVATAKARDGKISSLSDTVLELKGRLDAARDPQEHDDILEKLEAKQTELKKLYAVTQIAKTEPTQPV